TDGFGNEVQVIGMSGTAGTFTLAYNGASGAALTSPFTALTAAQVQANLIAIPGLNGNVTVFGANGGPYTVVFMNGLANQNVSLLTGTPSAITVGGGITTGLNEIQQITF